MGRRSLMSALLAIDMNRCERDLQPGNPLDLKLLVLSTDFKLISTLVPA